MRWEGIVTSSRTARRQGGVGRVRRMLTRMMPFIAAQAIGYSPHSRSVSTIAMRFSGLPEEWMLLELDRQ